MFALYNNFFLCHSNEVHVNAPWLVRATGIRAHSSESYLLRSSLRIGSQNGFACANNLNFYFHQNLFTSRMKVVICVGVSFNIFNLVIINL